MSTNTSQSSSLGSSSFLNLFGVLVSIVLCVLFVILGGHALKYLKEFACKIKIIVNRAEDKSVNLKDYQQQTKGGGTKSGDKQRSEAYQELETIYKNEIKKSRSLQYWIFLKNLIAKYDHLIYYPFRDRLMEQYDLLKPKTSFYTLLVVLSCCIAWMTTIFLSAILQSIYSDISTIPLATFIEVTIAIAIISSCLNIIATNRLFRIYLLTLKSAFRVDYGHQYKSLHENMKEYEPENSDEEKELFRHKDKLSQYEIEAEDLDREQENNYNSNYGEGDVNQQQENQFMQSQNMITQRELVERQDSDINTSRKLLAEDMDRSDKQLLDAEMQGSQQYNSVSNNLGNGPGGFGNFDHLTPNPQPSDLGNNSQLGIQSNISRPKSKAGKRIKDIFELQVVIDGADEANEDAKYIFVEDKHAIGDIDLLENEALKGENSSNVMTFSVLFIIVACASGVCCYLNYSFPATLAQYVFYMFVGSFVGDVIVSRPIILMIFALIRYCRAYSKGYRKVEYKQPKDIRSAYNKAIKDMFDNRKKYREEQLKKLNEYPTPTDKGTFSKTNPLADLLEHKGDKSQDLMLENYDHLTQNGDRHDTTTMKHPLDFPDNEQQEDQYDEDIVNKHDDDAEDGSVKNPMSELIHRVNPTEFARPQIEDDQKNFEKTQNLTQYNTSVPFLANLQKAVKEKEEEKLQTLMEQKQLNNDLVDYNLLLLKKIYDAYEERADKVVKNFRKDNRGVLRKRYMVPILNPNYDYEKLLKEMKGHKDEDDDGKEENVDEEFVKLDGITVCEDFEQQLMEAIMQEASDDLDSEQVDRQKIDKFGNPIDEFREDIKKQQLLPEFGEIEMELEDNQVEDDEYGRRMQMLADLKRRLANGEELTAEELALLEQLENERLRELEELIQSMLKKGDLTDEEKLTLIGYQKEKCHILLDQENRKKPRTEENELRIEELQDELRRLELDELKLRQKLYGLSDEELDRLYQLEQELLEKLMKRIKQLDEIGWDNLSNDEKFELLGLKKNCLQIELDRINRKKPPLSEQDLLRITEIEEELRNLEFQELLLKEQLGLLTDEERERLLHLKDHFARLEEEEMRRREMEEELRRKEMEEELRRSEMDELEMLRLKLLNGTITEEELRRLRELEAKYGLEAIANPFEPQMQLNEEFDQNMQEDEEQLKQEEEYNEEDILHSRITDQDNFQDLPPVEVMNNPNQSPVMLQDEEEVAADETFNNLGEATADADLSQIENQNQLDDSNIDPNLLVIAQQNQEDFNNLNESQGQDELERLLEKQRLGLLTPEEEERLRFLLEQQEREREAQQQLTDRQNLDDLAFGRDDLEMDNAAAIAADGESVYSHKTSAILDEEKVSFMHIDHLQNEDANSDESFAEQDMVYYDKDDLTRFSENRGINRVKRRQAPQYYSENDLQEVKEGDFSEGDSVSGRSAGGRSRKTMGRGYLSHNQLDTQSHEDLIEGRVKVDAWNLNYRKKKKKQKKRKVTDHTKRKMQDLQDIYGVDARTLANLKKGPLPRKQLAKKGKMTDEDFNQPPGSRMMSDNSFRTTMNTFAQNMQQTPGMKMQQSIADNQSNLFSFNGFGATRQNWGNGMKDSRFDNASSNNGKGNKKYPLTGIKKLTDTQQKFNNNNINGQFTGRDRNIPDDLDEESKSAYSASRSRGPSNNRFGSSGMGSVGGGRALGSIKNGKAGAKGAKGKKGGKQQNKNLKKAQIMRGSDGMDSHSESDEAVDDRGALFQRRNNFNDFYDRSPDGRPIGGHGGMNDMDHSESEEGNNQDIPNFQNNDMMFKKRGAVDQNQNQSQNRNQNNLGMTGGNSSNMKDTNGSSIGFGRLAAAGGVANNKASGVRSNSKNAAGANSKGNQLQGAKKGGEGSQRRVGGRHSNHGSTGDLNIEDLEAQSVQQRTGKKGQKPQGSQNKRGSVRSGSAERVDSEDENDGGQVMFQKRNNRADYAGQDLDRSGNARGRQQASNHKLNKSSSKQLNNSSSKPPLSGIKQKLSNALDDEEEKVYLDEEGHPYANPYNINGRVHPGVSGQIRNQNAGYGYSDMSDIDRQMRGTKYSNPSDGDQFGNTINSKKRGNNGGRASSSNGPNNNNTGNINANQLHLVGSGRLSDHMNNKLQRRRDRNGHGGRNDSDDDDGEDDYIVGPESNHSSLKKRPFRGLQGKNTAQDRDQNDEHYLLLQRERQIIEDIESDRDQTGNGILAKKRKIRKAAKSQNPRDAQQLRYQELQKERLKKMKKEAEGALFSKEDDLEAGIAKQKKKKKVKKEQVKKEINYWLDYDSPYAEYLVARFREWSPNPTLVGNPSANAQRNSMERSKYSEVANVYSKNVANGRGSSNGNSRSRDRGNKGSLNSSAQKFTKSNAVAKSKNRAGGQQKANAQPSRNHNHQQLSVNSNNGGGVHNGSFVQSRNQLFVDDFEEP